MKLIGSIGLAIPDVLLPKEGTDMTLWAVVACDQYTSEPQYWADVDKLVGDAPSTLRLIFPEVYLGKGGDEARIKEVQAKMHDYISRGIFTSSEGLVLVERTTTHNSVKVKRHGVMMCLDLEKYDYSKGSKSLIRATEGTIVE